MPVPACASTAHSSQATTASDESTASECSDTDSDQRKINMQTLALLAWEGQHMALDLFVQHDRLACTALLKLRTTVVFRALSPAESFLYLLIPPERVRTLTFDESPDPDTVPSVAAQILGTSLKCLRVSLSATLDLLGPQYVAHKPMNQAGGRVLDQLQSLMRSTDFTIWVPYRVFSESQLRSMCYGISDRLLRSEPGGFDLARLYEGRGAIKMAIGESDSPLKRPLEVVEESGDASHDKSPFYPDGGPAPRMTAGPAQPPAGKKRRLSSETTVALGADMLAAIKKMVREEVRIQVSEEVREEVRFHVSEEVRLLESRLNDNLETSINEHAEDLQLVRDEFDEKLEDDFYGVRMKLDDYIKEELTEAEERIIEHLKSTASVYLEFGS